MGKTNPKAKKGLWVVGSLATIFALFGDKTPSPDPSPPPAQVAPAVSSEPTPAAELPPLDLEPEPTPEPEPVEEEPAPPPTYNPPPPVEAPAAQSETIVHITRTGEKYHRAGCSSLRRSDIPIPLSSAQAQGYGACQRCDP